MPAVLIIGASRGIGAELVRQFLQDGWSVHATVRDPASPGELLDLPGPLHLHRLEVRDRDDVAALVAALPVLDLVVHNAGVYRAPEALLLEINTEAPLRIARALIEAGRVRSGGVYAFMSSGMGSRHGRASDPGGYSGSKARLNDVVRAQAGGWADEFGVVSIVLNPGWVRTDMGGRSAPLSVVESVSGMRRVLSAVTTRDNGRFLRWDGAQQPW